MRLLHLDSSILGANSVSRQISAAAVERVTNAHPGIAVTYRDLGSDPLPHLTLSVMPGAQPLPALEGSNAPAPETGLVQSETVLREFLAADIIVIGAPMYNFTISSQLKAWLDRILIAGKTFKYGPGGVEGLAGEKRVIVAMSRGGFYGAGTAEAAAEHAEAYMRAVFAMIGITPEFIIAEGIATGAEQRTKAIGAALQAVSSLAA